jgi:phosphohistidine phosphatase
MGAWMKQEQLIPDMVLSSPAKRAIATAKHVYKFIGDSQQHIRQDKRLYFQTVEQIKAVLAECPAPSKWVLLVGHNPELEDLLIDLIGVANVPVTDKLLPTTALARIAMPDDWSQLDAGCGQLLSITYVSSLPELI